MKCLVVAEHNHQKLSKSTFSVVMAASALSTEITLLVAGKDCLKVAQEGRYLEKIHHVIYADDEAYAHFLAENMAMLITSLASDYNYLLAPATNFGKNILPRVAAQLDSPMVSDVLRIESQDTFVRPIYAGNALATVQNQAAIKILSVRPSVFLPVKMRSEAAPIEEMKFLPAFFRGTQFLSSKISSSIRPELESARIVVSGGRGMQSHENFALIEQLADRLGAAIGASRAAVDAGFISNEFQVGQTGKVVAPDLYVAIGISGAIQHIAGIRDSKVIIAINKDPNAPIFEIADYGFVGDVLAIIPDLLHQL